MAGHAGNFYTLAIGRQTAKGTPQTTPKFKMRVTGGGLAPDPQILDLPETDTSIQRAPAVKVGQMISGTIEGFVRSDEMAMLAYGALGANATTGASPYTHTATASNASPYFTFYSAYDSTALVDQYSDCRINSLTIRGGANQALSYSADVLGITAVMGQTDPVLAVSTVTPLVYPHVTVTLAAATTDIVESFEITSTKNAEAIMGDTGMVPSDVVQGRWSVTGTMTILFETDAKWRLWLTNSTSGTASSPLIATEALTIAAVQTATSDEVSMIATAVELRRIGLQPDPGAGLPLRITYEFSCKPQATIANTYSIVSKNLVAAM